jgi:hypothetical protein
VPDHGTISLFRKNHLSALSNLFPQIVALSNGLGMIDPSDISVDGTKLKANASRKNLFEQVEIDRLKKKFEDYFAEAETIDAEEDKLYGDSIGYNMVPGSVDKEERKKKIKEMLDKMKKLKGAEKNIKDKQSKAVTKEDKDLRKNKTSNTSDPDANLMLMKNKSYKMAYNAQFATSNQIITAYALNNEPNDLTSLLPMIKLSEINTDTKVKTLKADAGYHNQTNIDFCDEHKIDSYIPDELKSLEERQERNNTVPIYDRRNFRYDKDKDCLYCPDGKILRFQEKRSKNSHRYIGTECEACPNRTKCTSGKKRHIILNSKLNEQIKTMRDKLNTDDGKRIYMKRMSDIEPVIGNIKHNQNFNYFLCRGKHAVLIELGLASVAHNLVKIFHWMKKNNKSREDIQWNTLMRLRTI